LVVYRVGVVVAVDAGEEDLYDVRSILSVHRRWSMAEESTFDFWLGLVAGSS